MRDDNITQQGDSPSPGGRSPGGYLLSWMRDLVLSLIIAIVVILFIYQPVQVEGTSMMPTLVDNERIFINKFTYRFGIESIERGDMVVFWPLDDRDKSYIKRVVGLPGDVVWIDAGIVYVNGQPLHEDYVPKEYRDDKSWAPVEVRQNHYYVLGDHRNSSNDSRGSLGQIHRDQIYGKAVFVYWPPEKIGPVR